MSKKTFFFLSTYLADKDEYVPTAFYSSPESAARRLQQEYRERGSALASTDEAKAAREQEDVFNGWSSRIEYGDFIIEELPVVSGADGAPSWLDSLPEEVDKEYAAFFGEDYHISQELREFITDIINKTVDRIGGCQIATPEIAYMLVNPSGGFSDDGSDDGYDDDYGDW